MAEYKNRNVVNLDIHNLSEEKFAELKEAGRLDPNALYLTPDKTTEKFSEVNSAIEQLNASLSDALAATLSAIYPVGGLFISTSSENTVAALIPDSQWELVEAGRALWLGDGSNANTTIAAGLPNVTGALGWRTGKVENNSATGAFSGSGNSGGNDATASNHGCFTSVSFNASRSSSVYGNSTTVQPPAYVVNVWRRTA